LNGTFNAFHQGNGFTHIDAGSFGRKNIANQWTIMQALKEFECAFYTSSIVFTSYPFSVIHSIDSVTPSKARQQNVTEIHNQSKTQECVGKINSQAKEIQA